MNVLSWSEEASSNWSMPNWIQKIETNENKESSSKKEVSPCMWESHKQGYSNDYNNDDHYHTDEGEQYKIVPGEADISHPSKHFLEEISHSLAERPSRQECRFHQLCDTKLYQSLS